MNVAFLEPGAQHERLRSLTGAWSARIRQFPTPNDPPIETTGEYLARMDLGGYFLCRDMNFGLQGYQGRGLTGYDVFENAYVGTWVDSTSPLIYRTLGHFDERGVYCELTGGPGADGSILRLRMTTEILGTNEMLFQMHHLADDGAECLVLEIAHTRRRFIK